MRLTYCHFPLLLATLILSATTVTAARDTLYVSLPGGNAIDTISPTGAITPWVTSGLNFPTALAFDSSGNLFVANTGNNSISKITPGGSVSTFVSTGLNYPIGLAFDKAGNLYVANELGNSITRITPGGGESTYDTAYLNQPVGLAFDSQGDLFVGNHGSSTPLTEIAPGGNATQLNSLSSWTWQVLGFDHTGDLFAASSGTGLDEVRFTPSPQESLFADMPQNINTFAFDSLGNIDVVGDTGVLYQVTPGGNISTIMGIPYSYFAIADPSVKLPVPEPSATLLFLVAAASNFLTRFCRHGRLKSGG